MKNKKIKYALVPEDLYKVNFCFISSVKKATKENRVTKLKARKFYEIASCLLDDYSNNVTSYVEK